MKNDPALSSRFFDRYAQAARAAGLDLAAFSALVGAGIVLQPKQLEFSAACISCDEPDGPEEVGFGGARGGGKSHAAIAQLTLDCVRYPGLTCLLLRKVGKANRENFAELRQKVLSGVATIWKQQEGVLIFPKHGNSKIILGHFRNEGDIDAYLGLEYDVILVEEATTLSAAKVKAIRTCNRSSKQGWRPRMYFTTNPGGVGHAWFKARFINRNHPKSSVFVASTVSDNLYINPEYKNQLESLTGWMLRAWRYGDWDIAAGQYFTTFRATKDGKPWHVLKPFKTPKSWTYWCSFDYGWTHYTVCHLGCKDNDGNIYVIDEHAARRIHPKIHAQAIHAMLERHGLNVRKLDRFVAGHDVFDKPNEEGEFLEDTYKKLGIVMTRANINRINGAGEILNRLGDPENPVDSPPSLFIFSNCQGLVNQLPMLEHDPHRPEDVLKVDVDEDGEGGDDFYDCGRYLVMESVRARPKTAGGAGGSRIDFNQLAKV